MFETAKTGIPILLFTVLSSGCGIMGSTSSTTSDGIFQLSAMADRAYESGQWYEAERHYQRLTSLVPDDSYAWFRLGNSYTRQGDFRKATEAFESASAFDAGQPKIWFNLATSYLLNAQIAMTHAYEQLPQNDPAREVISKNLSLIHI